MKAVFNTSPLCYLVLIELIEVLPDLFSEILVPETVLAELSHQDSPAVVREWASKPPPWAQIHSVDIEKLEWVHLGTEGN